MSSTPSVLCPQTSGSTTDVLAPEQAGEIGTASATSMDPIVAIMVYLYETEAVNAVD